MMNRIIAVIALSLSAMFVSVGASAEDMPAPQALVQKASDDMIAALKAHEQELAQDPSGVYALVDEILITHFDFERMSRLALGKNWRDISEAQQQQFVEEFKLLLIRTYSTAMLEYTDEEIRMLPFRDDVSKKRVTVPMEVIQKSGPSIPMALSLYENDNGDWKVYDVKIDGISLVTNYRSSFANEIRQGGMDKLLQDLAERNAKLKP